MPITAAELELLVRVNVPIVSLSSYISSGLDAAIARAATSPRRLRKSGQALTERLKQQSRSTARGGSQDLSLLDSPTKLRGSNKASRQGDKSSALCPEHCL